MATLQHVGGTVRMIGARLPQHLHVVAQTLDGAVRLQAELRGKAMSTEQAVAYAVAVIEGENAGGATGLPIERLSAREREVAALAATGLSNAQFAEQLVVTTKTVGNHLARIFAKLDCHSRGQLIARPGTQPDAAGAVVERRPRCSAASRSGYGASAFGHYPGHICSCTAR